MIGSWDAMVSLAKACAYAATLGAAGGVFFLTYNRAAIDGSGAVAIRRLITVLLVVSAAASVAKVMLTAGSMSGDPAGMIDPDLERMILQTGEGRALGMRLLGLVCMAWWAVARARPVEALPAPAPAVVGAIIAATSFAWSGHTHAVGMSSAAVLVAVHALGVALWLGALVPLLLVCRDANVARRARAVSRFGAVAVPVVGVLFLAGLVVAWTVLRGVDEWWSHDYGRLLLLKITLVAVLLALAAFNHRLTPRLSWHGERALNALRRSIWLEILLVCSILLVTAAMTTLVGPA